MRPRFRRSFGGGGVRSPVSDQTTTKARSQADGVGWRPFWTVSSALFALLMGANLPTPLYDVYRQRFGFSSAVLTLVFATYAVVLIPSLLVFGQLSDRLGRRRVLMLGLGAAAVALALFAAAQGTGWLFAARAVQALAILGGCGFGVSPRFQAAS